MSVSLDTLIGAFVSALLPALVLIFGGRWVLNRYDLGKRKKEYEMDLISTIRKEQYRTLSQLYVLFAQFMEFFRLINLPSTDLSDIRLRRELLDKIVKAEAEVDSLILKIGCEFIDAGTDSEQMGSMLGQLRQSVQLWRERVVNGEKLPFDRSSQDDYVRFKESFAHIAAFMINKIHRKQTVPQVTMDKVGEILVGAFDNKHEKWNREMNGKWACRKYYKSDI